MPVASEGSEGSSSNSEASTPKSLNLLGLGNGQVWELCQAVPARHGHVLHSSQVAWIFLSTLLKRVKMFIKFLCSWPSGRKDAWKTTFLPERKRPGLPNPAHEWNKLSKLLYTTLIPSTSQCKTPPAIHTDHSRNSRTKQASTQLPPRSSSSSCTAFPGASRVSGPPLAGELPDLLPRLRQRWGSAQTVRRLRPPHEVVVFGCC